MLFLFVFVLLLLLFYIIATVFQLDLYLGGDLMYEMRRRKHEPTLVPTQGIFNFSHQSLLNYVCCCIIPQQQYFSCIMVMI